MFRLLGEAGRCSLSNTDDMMDAPYTAHSRNCLHRRFRVVDNVSYHMRASVDIVNNNSHETADDVFEWIHTRRASLPFSAVPCAA
jgi:hypothetical protein